MGANPRKGEKEDGEGSGNYSKNGRKRRKGEKKNRRKEDRRESVGQDPEWFVGREEGEKQEHTHRDNLSLLFFLSSPRVSPCAAPVSCPWKKNIEKEASTGRPVSRSSPDVVVGISIFPRQPNTNPGKQGFVNR